MGAGGGGDLSCPLTPPLSVNIWRRVCVKVAEAAVSVVSERKEMNRILNRSWKEERVHRGAAQTRCVPEYWPGSSFQPCVIPLVKAPPARQR